MAGRLAWILAGGAAIVGGMAMQEDWIRAEIGDHDPVVEEAIAEAKASEGRIVSARIVDGNGRRVEADQVEALTDAVAALVKAEAALAIAEMDSGEDPGKLAQARAHRDETRAVVDAMKADIQARKAANTARDAVRDQVREDVRDAVRGS